MTVTNTFVTLEIKEDRNTTKTYTAALFNLGILFVIQYMRDLEVIEKKFKNAMKKGKEIEIYASETYDEKDSQGVSTYKGKSAHFNSWREDPEIKTLLDTSKDFREFLGMLIQY